MYTFILGNVKLDSACHYWRVHVDEFNSHNKLSIIGKCNSPIGSSETHARDNFVLKVGRKLSSFSQPSQWSFGVPLLQGGVNQTFGPSAGLEV